MEKVQWEGMAKAFEFEKGIKSVERLGLQERVLLKAGVKVKKFLLQDQEESPSPAVGESSLFPARSFALEKHFA